MGGIPCRALAAIDGESAGKQNRENAGGGARPEARARGAPDSQGMFRTLVAKTAAATDDDRLRRLIASEAVSGANDFLTFLISGPAALRLRPPTPAVANPVGRGPFGRGPGRRSQAGGRVRALRKESPVSR
jgi:hypothetical protein